MSMNYPMFTSNNESVILFPGSRFSKKELLSRLHDIDPNIDNTLDKNNLIKLYDSYLSVDRNKFKIFNRLQKDTEYQKSRMGLSQKQSLLTSNANANTFSRDSKAKVLNISQEVKPFSEQQNVNKSIRGANSKNTIASNNNNINYGYNDNQLGRNSSNNYQDYSRNIQNIKYSNDSNFYNYSNNQSQNRNQSQINYQQKYDNSVSNQNNNVSNKYSMNSNMNDKYNTSNQHYQEEINTDINRNSQRYIQNSTNEDNQKLYTNIETPNPNYQESKNSLLRSGNSNNYGNSNSHINFSFNNNYSNINSSINSSNQVNPYRNQYQNSNDQRMIIEEQNQSQFPIDENRSENNQQYKREPDEESSFSMFSVFKDFKNSPLYKNRKEICFNLILSLIVILAAIGALFLIYKTWDSITNFFAEFFKALTEPQRIIEGIWGFISSIIFGSIRYFYISIPLILLIVVFVIYLRKYLFKKRCKKIMEKILEYLKNNENRENNIITEDDIYTQFVQGYGVSYKEFKNKYMKQLDRMRRDYSLKAHSNEINGKKVNYWDLL